MATQFFAEFELMTAGSLIAINGLILRPIYRYQVVSVLQVIRVCLSPMACPSVTAAAIGAVIYWLGRRARI